MTNKKTAKFTEKGIETLAKNKPVLYQILNANEKMIKSAKPFQNKKGK